MVRRFRVPAVIAASAAVAFLYAQSKPAENGDDWPMYTHDLAGTRYSPLKQINKANVSKLSTPVRNYGDVFRSSCEGQLFGGDLGQKGVKIAASERPFEGHRRPFIVALESQQTLFEFGQRREIIGGEDLSLND